MSIEINKEEEPIYLTEKDAKNLTFEELCQLNKYPRLKIQKELNNGLSSTVFLALNELKQKVVIKIFNRSSKDAYLREKEFFKNNQNFQNIIKVYDYGLIDNRRDPYFGHYYLVMGYAEKGDLVNYIEQQNNNENEAKKIIRQILNGYDEISNCGYIHRDLKPENILIMNDNTLKITDFGFCEKMNCVSAKKIGTDGYMPPEVLKNEHLIPQQIDVFSLGVILFLLVAGEFPFGEPNQDDEFYKYIIEENWEEYWKLVDSDNNFSQDLKNLIQGMICYEPKKRFNNEKIKSSQWLSCGTN
jgi:serine/threonine protein kinase